MSILDFIKKKREEEREKKREDEVYRRRIIMEMQLRGEKPHLKKMPEEIELDGYMEETRRDKIREIVQQERAKRSMFGYKGKTNNIKIPKPKVTKFKKNKFSLGKCW
jgi:hypothetical protein